MRLGDLTYFVAKPIVAAGIAGVLSGLMALTGCTSLPPPTPDPQAALIAKGRQVFFNETFNGNGRTCGTCHPAENNFTIDPTFIATLPPNNPLFVAEFDPNLKENFEKAELMRKFGLILENLDGFDDLKNKFVMRGVPQLLSLRTRDMTPQGPRTGWSGDGAPGDGSLRSFATGAVVQHFTKTLNRIPGVDFRLPTNEELDALLAFQLSLGRQQDLTLPLPLKGTVPKRGQDLFLDNTVGKCTLCHLNAGATANLGQGNLGNANFNTGVEDLPDQPARLTGQLVPRDDGFGRPGDGTFKMPPLVEAASTSPFFHNDAVQTIEGAVAFYDGNAFNNSPAGVLLAGLDPNGNGIELDATQIVAIAAFLRVINALEHIRITTGQLEGSLQEPTPGQANEILKLAVHETDHSIRVLEDGGLHPDAVAHLQKAKKFTSRAARSIFFRGRYTREAIQEQQKAKALLVESS